MADTLIREATAYGSQPLSPVPQYWDGSTSYEKVEGNDGAIYVELITSSGGTARFSGANPGSVQLTATSTVVVSGTATVNFSGSGTVAISGNVTAVISGNVTAVNNVVGTHANAWSASATISAGATSNTIDIQHCNNMNAFGEVTATASITFLLQLSQDGTNFYNITSAYTFTASAGTSVNFLIASSSIVARYVRLITSGVSATITATIAGK